MGILGRIPKQSSGKSLTIHAKSLPDEEKIRAFKEIHARNPDLQIKETMMECVNRFLSRHNWPPGNSQTLLQVFLEPIMHKCFRCKQLFSWLRKVLFISGRVEGLCSECFDKEQSKGAYCTIKKTLGVIGERELKST